MGLAGAEWVSWVFASIFAALTIFYVVRLIVSARRAPPRVAGAERSVDVSRGVMSLGMVTMLVPWLDPLPRLVWQVLFVLVAGHIAVRLLRRTVSTVPESGGRHELHLLVGALAMVYMVAVTPAEHGMAHGPPMGSAGLAIPLVTWALVAYFLVFVVRLSARLAVPVTGVAATCRRVLAVSPHLLGSSEVVMGIGMSYMLIIML